MKPKYSGMDSKGKIYIDCSECERGLNGDDKDKCSCAKSKKGGMGMCFNGILMSKYEEIR